MMEAADAEAVRDREAKVADWLLATFRLYGVEEARAHRIVAIFLDAVANGEEEPSR